MFECCIPISKGSFADRALKSQRKKILHASETEIDCLRISYLVEFIRPFRLLLCVVPKIGYRIGKCHKFDVGT